MPVQALGYIGVDARDFDPWRRFATDVFAMQVVERGPDALACRVDDRCQRVLVQRSDRDGPAFFGFETAGAEEMKETAGKLEAAGFKVTRANEKELTLRGVDEMAWCRDPAGNRIELFHGQATGEGPFTAPRPHGGFRTGTMGMGHMVLHAEDIDAMSAFYRELLGLRLSDYMVKPYRLMFLRANPRHHSVGLLQSKQNGVHHVMLEVLALDDERRKTANEIRRKTILSGLGAPLQVTRGQFKEVE